MRKHSMAPLGWSTAQTPGVIGLSDHRCDGNNLCGYNVRTAGLGFQGWKIYMNLFNRSLEGHLWLRSSRSTGIG